MSQCFRTISSKLPPFVGTRKQVTCFDRPSSQYLKSTAFSEENAICLTRTTSALQFNKNFSRNLSLQCQPIVRFDLPRKTSSIFLEESKILKLNEIELCQRYPIILLLTSKKIESSVIKWRSRRRFRKQLNNYIPEVSLRGFANQSSRVNYLLPRDTKENCLLLTTEGLHPQKEVSPEHNSSREKLEFVYNKLGQDLPMLFVKSIDYSIYRQDIIFVNNIRGTTTMGIFHYVRQIVLLKTVGYLKFAFLKFDVLKITMHPEDNTVKVRWRIRGNPGISFFSFWKFNILKLSETLEDSEVWFDGFSTYFVGGDGKIYKHVADKMMPDQEAEISKFKTGVAAKLALFAGFANPRQILSDTTLSMPDLGLFFSKTKKEEDN